MSNQARRGDNHTSNGRLNQKAKMSDKPGNVWYSRKQTTVQLNPHEENRENSNVQN